MTQTVDLTDLPDLLGRLAGGTYETAVESRAELDKTVAALHAHGGAGRVLVVRGAHCTTDRELFREFAAVLQFPLWFGDNWDALHDSLDDNRTDADRVVLVVSDAGSLLRDDPGKLPALLEELAEWAGDAEPPRPGWRYRTVVLADTATGLSRLRTTG